MSTNNQATRNMVKATCSHVRPYIIAVIATFILYGCGADRMIRKGDKHLALGEYHDAATCYRKAYRQLAPKDKEQRGKAALKMAKCYDKLNQSQRAVASYANAVRYGQATIDDKLGYARQLLKNGSYKDAADMFRTVLDSMPGNELATNGLQSALNAPRIKQTGSRYKVKRMDVFNSRRADFSPVLAGDNFDHLYFTSTRNEAEGNELSGITGTKNGDIFVSVKDDRGKWTKPEPLDGGLNTAFDEGACCLTADGREMYLTQCVTSPSAPRYAEIATSTRSDAAWGKASKTDLTRDTLSSYAHPAISPDGQWLYFVSDMPGGKGGMDIWRIRMTEVGLGGVENLGEPINTAGDEMFPTFRPNGDLYFSSNGHPGMGGLDIFIAKANSKKGYDLYHPGYPLNSQADDFGMTFEGPHNRGYFSSNRGDGRGWDNIYAFENPEVVNTIKGWVYEADGYELPQAEVYMVGNDGTNKRITLRSDGSFTQVVTPGVSYVMLATCKGYLNHKAETTIKETTESEETVIQFPLISITAPVLIDNIFYDFDRATLRPESTQALDNLVTLLNENGNITIELSAHCDYKGSSEYNKALSQRRAEAVVNYLIDKGIARDRLNPVGYGKEKPKTIRRKLTERLPWLKEGDVLTEEFINTLDKEKQEIANQLNRRTEFQVLRTTYGLFDSKGNLKPGKNASQPAKSAKEEEPDVFFE